MRSLTLAIVSLLLWLGASLPAADLRPMVGPGATKDEVLNAYGWPSGQSQAGAKEVLTYPQGKVTLENGRVESVDFSMTKPWPPPRPKPGTTPVAAPKKIEDAASFWLTDFDQAAKEAERRKARIMVLFSGSDWSQASKQFREQVAYNPDFINAFMADYVFLELDFPLRAPQSAEQREQNTRLRDRYAVATYPSILVLSPTGEQQLRIDLSQLPDGDNYRTRVISAIRGAHAALVAPPPTEAPPVAANAAPTPEKTTSARTEQWKDFMQSAKSLVGTGVVAGLGTSIFLLWLVWRKRAAPPPMRATPISERIADAASGLPSPGEISHWPRPKLRALAAGLGEAEGYRAEMREEGSDIDLALGRPEDSKPSILVLCSTATSTAASGNLARELFGSMTAEGVPAGWLIFPAGFSAEARQVAEANNITLMDAKELSVQLHDLPPIKLPQVLARATRAGQPEK